MKTLRHFDIAQCKLHSVAGFFFCISLIILLASLSFPQSVRDEIKKIGGSPAYTGSWTPANLPIDTTTTSVFFYGDKITTKVSKDSGGTRAIPYMRVWVDSSNQIVNGTFDTDSIGWVGSGNLPDAFRWVASGGGYTGAIRITGTAAEDGFSQTNIPILMPSGEYNFKVDINITAISGCSLWVWIPRFDYNKFITSTGEINIDTIITKPSSTSKTAFIYFVQFEEGGITAYVDNVSLIPIADSTYGYTYITTRPSDTTTFYYSQSVWWRQKDKDTIWLAAETDTVTVYPYIPPPHTYLVNQDGGKILIKGGTYAIKFKD